MELTGQQIIRASRETVYDALNDPVILKQCIPGCEELDKTSDTQMDAIVAIKVGPVRARFKGAVELTNLNPPESYTIIGEGKGGAAGFAKGSADVCLTGQADATLLDYSVKADVGGKLAQLGGRLIDSTAKKLSGEFFQKFGELVGQPDDGSGEAGAGLPIPPDEFSEAAADQKPKKNTTEVIALLVIALCVVYVVFIAGAD